MRNIGTLFLFQIKLLVKNWRVLLLFFVVPPLLFASLFFLLEQLLNKENRMDPFKMAIVDQDRTVETALVIKQLEDNEQLQQLVHLIETDEETANKFIQANQIAGILIIPEGFSKDVRKGINTPVTVIGNENQALQAALVRYLIESAADLTSAAQSGINTIYDFLTAEGVQKRERNDEFKKSVVSFSLHIIGRNSTFKEIFYDHLYLANLREYYLLSFYILTLFGWGFGSVFLLKREVFTTVELRLRTRGVLPIQKIIADQSALLVILNFVAIFAGAALTIFLKLEMNLLIMMLTSMLIMTVFSTLFMMLYTISGSLKVYQFIGVLLIIISSIISGHFFPTSFLPIWLENISAYWVNTLALQQMFSIAGGIETNIGFFLFLIMIAQIFVTLFFVVLNGKVG